ncbi:hypothetical protein F4820DRAFT_465383 [Hypoxylon rubiginosum]|uniref:Uncharacterized protein n=1 Tax=Hypoxylon rubiginosum TaxID=110542 RepID=A0ACB9YNI3_9PEZI|nr:hypothetical protein F4820DRAFT_465383 [Hypoxylon rubiginosum]
MTDSNAPRMPMAASGNMAMNMSTVSATSQKLSEMAIEAATPNQDASKAADIQPQIKQSKLAATSSRTLASTSSQLEMTRSREKAFNMQRIQLAEQLGSERKQRTELEALLVDLQQELASLTSNNEASVVECTRLHGEIQQLKSEATETAEWVVAMQKDIINLECKLKEVTADLEQSILSRDTLQKAHDEAVENYDRQTRKVLELEEELKAKIRDLDAANKKLQEVHDDDVKFTIPSIHEAHKSRESDLQQRLARKGTEAKNLRRELNALRLTWAEAVMKKEVAEQELIDNTEEQRVEASQAQQELADSRKQFDELQKLIVPFPQTVVICVDPSGSTAGSVHEIKQAYRDVLHKIKSSNDDARAAVVIHGSSMRPDPSPLEAVSDATFRMMDSVGSIGGSEDYTYCLEKANGIFKADVDSQKLLILIGDGDAICSNLFSVNDTLGQLSSAGILAHSIVLSNGPENLWFAGDLTMKDISLWTGGRVEDKDTYLSALEEIFRHEREQHFRKSEE